MQIGELACTPRLRRDTLRFHEKAACRCELERAGAGCPLDAQAETIA
jgi:hypothetical protein